MTIKFVDLLNELSTSKRRNEVYYNAEELCQRLETIECVELSIGDEHLLEFFYLYPNGGTYNLYWCCITLLSIGKPAQCDHDSYLPESEQSLDRLAKPDTNKFHLWLAKQETTFHAANLISHINFLKSSSEVIGEINVVFSKHNENFVYDERYLYFAVY